MQPDADTFFAAEDADARDEAKADGPKPNGHDPDPPARLTPINPATLEGLPIPPPQWLVPDWVPMKRVTALHGPGGEGKTLIAQQLATSCAIGKPWLGLPVRQCRSLLFFCEDDLEEMHCRQADINSHHGCTFADIAGMGWLPRLGDDNELMTFGNGRATVTTLLDQIVTAAKEHQAKLIITDTLSDVFAGNENDRSQARAFAQRVLGYLARETQGAVVVLAHPSQHGINTGSGESGSTAWRGAYRSQLYFATPKPVDRDLPSDPDIRELTRKKANFARRDDVIEVRWRNGVFVTTREPTGILGSIIRRTCERVFLDLLARTNAEGRRVSHKPNSQNFAPLMFERRPDREGFKKPDFRRAMETLIPAGKIKISRYRGTNRSEYECLAPVE